MSATAWPDDAGAWADALLDPARACPPGLVAWNGSDVSVRFAVHRNNVVAGLVDALADGFPVVCQLVGEAFFRAMAAVYVRGHPPRSPVLADYGEDFAAFIAGFGPADPVPYLADVARLEHAWVCAYHAADRPPLDVDAARRALGDGVGVGALRLALHPSVALVRSAHAVVSIWGAHGDGTDLAEVDPTQAETALVLRCGLEVRVSAVDAGTAAFIDALHARQPLAAAAAAALAAAPDFDLSAGLAGLLARQAIVSIQSDPGTPP
jgi:hypothetical protein